MSERSNIQRNLLARFREAAGPQSLLLRNFLEFLQEKEADEPLDPQWLDMWDKYKRAAIRVMPPSVVKDIEEKLSSIKPDDPEISEITIREDTKVTFLLGAGSSAPSGIPTVDKLLSELWKRARKIGRDDLDKLADWCTERGITNIEDLLTTAYISNFAAKNRNITSLLDYFLFSGGRVSREEEEFIARRDRPIIRVSEIDVSAIGFLQDTLQTLFGLLTSTMITASPNPAHEAIVEFIKRHKSTSLITTNYDGCMDEAILNSKLEIKPKIFEEKGHEDKDTIELVKMHGSINWAYCDSCQDVHEFDLLELKRIFEKDILSYPVIGICKNCGGLRRPLLVPPLSFKFLMFPNLVDIWNTARLRIEGSEYLIVIGYSFSEADTYITKIISRSMSMNAGQRMIVVNTNRNLVPGLRERFSAHIDGFDEKRILRVCESCEKALPGLLSSLIRRIGE